LPPHGRNITVSHVGGSDALLAARLAAGDDHAVVRRVDAGGGTWDISLGRASRTQAAVAIVTDALGFCGLAANRTTPAGLDSHITGYPDRAAAVLAAATALALD
jgi:hypothetical protein